MNSLRAAFLRSLAEDYERWATDEAYREERRRLTAENAELRKQLAAVGTTGDDGSANEQLSSKMDSRVKDLETRNTSYATGSIRGEHPR